MFMSLKVRKYFLYIQDVVLLLLKFGAGVSIINGEGRTPLQMADDEEVQKLIKGCFIDNLFHQCKSCQFSKALSSFNLFCQILLL